MTKKLRPDYRCGHGLPQLKYDRKGDFGKDVFRKDAKGYMRSLSYHLKMAGYAEVKTHWNEAGPASSGECYLAAFKEEGDLCGLYLWVEGSALRFTGKREDGIVFTAREQDRREPRLHTFMGRNQEPSPDLDSAQMAGWLMSNIQPLANRRNNVTA